MENFFRDHPLTLIPHHAVRGEEQSSRRSGRKASVQGNDLTRHVAGGVGHEIERKETHFPDGSETTERDQSLIVSFDRTVALAGKRDPVWDDTWGDRIHVDAIWRPFDSEGSRQSRQGALGCRVQTHMRSAAERRE